MDKLYVIKIGGQVVDNESALDDFLRAFATVEGHKVLVHGGGKLATRMAEGLGIPQQMVDGRRITDRETLRVVTMVYAGWINKTIVAALQARSCQAIGLSGADGNVIKAHQRTGADRDYGFAGDVDRVDAALMTKLLESGLTPVLCPITHDRKGQLLNTNADTIAQETAQALAKIFEVVLVYCFEKSGVLLDAADDRSVISRITPGYYNELKEKGLVFAGMIPKLDNAFSALQRGVSRVVIGRSEELSQLVREEKGTSIVHE